MIVFLDFKISFENMKLMLHIKLQPIQKALKLAIKELSGFNVSLITSVFCFKQWGINGVFGLFKNPKRN